MIFSIILGIIDIDNFIKSINKMQILKKIWLLLTWLFVIFGINFSFAQLAGSHSEHPNGYGWSDTPIISGNTVNTGNSISQWSNVFSDKLKGIISIPQPENYTSSLTYVVALIQIAVNRLLWLLALVALVYMLYNWFLIFTSWSESKNADKGKKWISTAAIALAWIGLSWLIISAILRLINGIAAN